VGKTEQGKRGEAGVYTGDYGRQKANVKKPKGNAKRGYNVETMGKIRRRPRSNKGANLTTG